MELNSIGFSVLISVYFKEKPEYLKVSLESIWDKQSIKPSEIVIVKDGHLPKALNNVVDEFSKYTPTKIITFEKNMGLGIALNEGIKYCSFDLVARMDSDDICKYDRFEKQLNIFEQYPNVSVVSGYVEEFSTDIDEVESVRKLPEFNDELVEYAKSKNPMNHPAVMFKKSHIEAVGGYQDFYLLEDYWLWIRMIKHGYKLYNIQEVILSMRGGIAMAARRGGLKYALSEIKFQEQLYRMKMINILTLIKNVIIRFIVRIMPKSLRLIVYKNLLRNKI